MSFFDKIKFAIKKIKGKLIVALILVLAIIIFGIAPFSVAMLKARSVSDEVFFDWAIFFEQLYVQLPTPPNAFLDCLTIDEYRSAFFYITRTFLGVYAIFVIYGIARAFPKNEYESIENGSSDWSVGGEQYKILNKKRGIVLAEKNYLPVDKRGNVNVLVVRRLWCWKISIICYTKCIAIIRILCIYRSKR